MFINVQDRRICIYMYVNRYNGSSRCRWCYLSEKKKKVKKKVVESSWLPENYTQEKTERTERTGRKKKKKKKNKGKK